MPALTPIIVSTIVAVPAAKAWECWTEPKHIVQWNAASDDWHTPRATNDLREGGSFTSRMEAKDGSVGFDFEGTYTKIVPYKQIDYVMSDGRKVSVQFVERDGKTEMTETFDPETENPTEMQRAGWQAILESFRKHAEAQA